MNFDELDKDGNGFLSCEVGPPFLACEGRRRPAHSACQIFVFFNLMKVRYKRGRCFSPPLT